MEIFNLIGRIVFGVNLPCHCIGMEDGESVLLLPECEAFVQSLQTTSLDDFGSSR